MEKEITVKKLNIEEWRNISDNGKKFYTCMNPECKDTDDIKKYAPSDHRPIGRARSCYNCGESKYLKWGDEPKIWKERRSEQYKMKHIRKEMKERGEIV